MEGGRHSNRDEGEKEEERKWRRKLQGQKERNIYTQQNIIQT